MKYLIITCSICTLFAGCSTRPAVQVHDKRADSIQNSLSGHDHVNWIIKEFPSMGIQVEVPKESYVDDQFLNSSKPPIALYINLYPVRAARYLLADTQWLLSIKIERMKKEEFDKEIVNLWRGRSDEEKRFWQWKFSFTPKLQQFNDDKVFYFRRDIACSNGDILSMYGELIRSYQGKSKEANEVAIRIFDSVNVK